MSTQLARNIYACNGWCQAEELRGLLLPSCGNEDVSCGVELVSEDICLIVSIVLAWVLL